MSDVVQSTPAFGAVKANRPGRSAFDLSHMKLFTADMGQLIPICAMETLPGDSFTIALEAVLRFTPQIRPVLHQIDAYFHFWFVPNRLTWADWEAFITGGADGQDAHTLPVWTPAAHGVGSLWDYFGHPDVVLPAGFKPIAFPLRAYNLIYNAWYRDQTQIAEVSLDDEAVKKRAWPKDYFTSALPWQQRGLALALPVTGTAVWQASTFPSGVSGDANLDVKNAADPRIMNSTGGVQNATNTLNAFNANTVNLTTFNVSDLRTSFQLQKWQERNARAGARYTEFLLSHFGEDVEDYRLQRPEYIGGCRVPVQISEVLQTSESNTTPQGTMAGHAMATGRESIGHYRCKEFGWIIGIMSVMPKAMYSQGINRQWLKTTRYDYYSPEFAHLSEQPVYRGELYADTLLANNTTVFGYQGKFNELRYIPSQTMGLMRKGVATDISNWHLSRYFTGVPSLNQTFLECVPRKDFLVAPTEPALMCHIANLVKAVRPLPIEPEPGLIDHT